MINKVSVLLLWFMATLVFGGAVLTDFRAEAGLNKVELRWTVTAEAAIKGYRILRSFDNAQFQKIGYLAAEGIDGSEHTYRFVDNSVFKSSGRVYFYKLEFVHQDGSSSEYEKIVTVSPQISSTRHTWGSLKAMFR